MLLETVSPELGGHVNGPVIESEGVRATGGRTTRGHRRCRARFTPRSDRRRVYWGHAARAVLSPTMPDSHPAILGYQRLHGHRSLPPYRRCMVCLDDPVICISRDARRRAFPGHAAPPGHAFQRIPGRQPGFLCLLARPPSPARACRDIFSPCDDAGSARLVYPPGTSHIYSDPR